MPSQRGFPRARLARSKRLNTLFFGQSDMITSRNVEFPQFPRLSIL